MLARPLRLVTLSLSVLIASLAFASESIVYNFSPQNNGGINPAGGLFVDGAGNIYGTTLDGTLFQFTPNGSGGWNYSVLCNCPGTYAYGSPVMDQHGNLYASDYWGEIYQYTPGSQGKWTSKLLYTFTGPSGSGPSPLLIDSSGKLYGIYAYGGSHNKGYVFELSQNSSGAWSLTHLHDFNGTDGTATSQNNAYTLVGGLIMDSAGNLYGTTGQGGSSKACASGCGVVFKLTKSSSGSWSETVLHSFTGTDGSNPDATLLMDASGNLFGTTTDGGANGFGAVFEIPASGSGRVLHSFTNKNGDGAYPNSALVIDRSGNIYGTTEAGGGYSNCTVVNDNGCGTVFELQNTPTGYKESILQKFSGKANGGFPGGVIFGVDGNLYGVAEVGGANNLGLFFKIAR